MRYTPNPLAATKSTATQKGVANQPQSVASEPAFPCYPERVVGHAPAWLKHGKRYKSNNEGDGPCEICRTPTEWVNSFQCSYCCRQLCIDCRRFCRVKPSMYSPHASCAGIFCGRCCPIHLCNPAPPGGVTEGDHPEQTGYAPLPDPRSVNPSSSRIIPLRSHTRWPDSEEVERRIEGNPWYSLENDGKNEREYPVGSIENNTFQSQSAPVQPPWDKSEWSQLLQSLGRTPRKVSWDTAQPPKNGYEASTKPASTGLGTD